MGQNGDPDDCVRFGYLWGLNGGEVALLLGLHYVKYSLIANAFILFSIGLIAVIFRPPKPVVKDLSVS